MAGIRTTILKRNRLTVAERWKSTNVFERSSRREKKKETCNKLEEAFDSGGSRAAHMAADTAAGKCRNDKQWKSKLMETSCAD